jgi:hypothetical protein
VDFGRVALGSNGALLIDDSVKVQDLGGGFAGVANAGTGGTTIGNDARLGSVVSQSSITVGQRSTVNGSATSGGQVTLNLGASVTGAITRSATLTPASTVTWSAPTPGPSLGDVTLQPSATRTLPPGNYGNLTAYGRSTLTLGAGVYFFTSIDVEAQAVLSFSGPTVLYVSSNVIYRGSIVDVVGDASLLVAFYGKSLEARASATIAHAGFPLPPSPCTGVADGTSCSSTGVAGGGGAGDGGTGNGGPVNGDAAAGSAGAGVCSKGSCVAVSCGSPSGSQPSTSFSVQVPGGVATYAQVDVGTPTQPAMNTSVALNGQLIESVTRTGPNASGVATATATFGATLVHGIHQMTAQSDGTTVNEVIDGRALQPFPASAAAPGTTQPPPLVFVDGQPAPVVTLDDGVQQALAAVGHVASAAVSTCTGTPQIIANVPPPPPVSSPHDSSGKIQSNCSGCHDDCNTNAEICFGIAFTDCSAATFLVDLAAGPLAAFGTGVACNAGLTIDVCNAVKLTCFNNCDAVGAGACCPVSCGSTCCEFGEACVPNSNLCCGQGFATCTGTSTTSCVEPGQAVCLPSGAGCPTGVLTCGTGANQVCCPGGHCNGNTCSTAIFGIQAVLSKTSNGPNICISGTGFTDGASVTIQYLNVPFGGNVTGLQAPNELAPVVDTNGNFGLTDTGQASRAVSNCVATVADGNVTITAKDGDPATVGTGNTATTQVPAALWCSNFLSASTGVCP